MPSNAQVIKEFLVSLGYEIDKESAHRFQGEVQSATTRVSNLGKAAVGTAAAIELMVKRISDRLTDLYFMSERTGATAENLEAIGYAARTAGIGVADMQSLVEGLALRIRTNPGNEGLLHQLGVQTRDAQGNLRDTTKVFDDLIGHLAAMGKPGSPGFVIANQFAQMFGIPTDKLINLELHNAERIAEAKEMLKWQQQAGVNETELTKQSDAFSIELNRLDHRFAVLGERLEQDFLPAAMKLTEWGQEAVEWFTQLDRETDGWASGLLGLSSGELVLMRLFGIIGRITGGAAAMGGALTEAGAVGLSAFAWVPQTVALLSAFVNFKAGQQLTADSGGSMLGINNLTGQPINRDASDDPLVHFGEGIGRWLHGGGANIEIPGPGAASGDMGNRVMQYFMKQGWSRAQAAGIAASLQRESSFNTGLTGDTGKAFGIAQWHPDRQEHFRKWAGHDIRQSNLDEQLGFIQYELTRGGEQMAGNALRGANTPAEAGAAFTGFERPRDMVGEMVARSNLAESWAKSSVNMSQTNNVTINGATDPHATAAAVGGAQKDANADLIRNFDSVMQ
jgi:hypothetical protein